MSEGATDVIVARTSRAESMASAVAGSFALHVIGIVLLTLFAASTRSSGPPPVLMMVNLAGSVGPETGGLTQLPGRGVPQAKPDPEPQPEPRPEPPPPAVPKMTLPTEKPRPRAESRKAPEPQPREKEAPPAHVQQGNAPVETGARGVGFGLSSAGGGSVESTVRLDTPDFCCNEYLAVMVTTIRRNWEQNQGNHGLTVMKFTIARNGQLSDIQIEQSSGFAALDRAAQRALALTTLQPLPDRYTNATLTVHIKFEY